MTTIGRGYIRVSTEEQALEGYSLEAQTASLRAAAHEKGWTLAEIYLDEGISAKSMKKRKDLQRLLQDIGRDEVLVVWKLDRLNRNVLDSENVFQLLDNRGALFYSVAEPHLSSAGPGGKFTRQIMAAVAELYSGTLGENVRHGMAQLVRQGKWSGGFRPFGYENTDKGLKPNHEAPVVRQMFEWYISGLGTRAVAIKLNEAGIRTARGGIWNSATVGYILRQVLYCGKVSFGRRYTSGRKQAPERVIIAEGEQEAIVDDETWHQAQAVMERRKSFGSRHVSGDYPFTGIARCELCGAAVGGTKYKSDKEHKQPRRVYRCAKRQHTKRCTLPIQSADRLEAIFLAEVTDLLSNPDKFKAKVDAQRPTTPDPTTAADARKQLANVDKQIARWQAAYNAETLDLDEFAAKVKPLREQRKGLLSQIDQTDQRGAPAQLEAMMAVTRSIVDLWAGATWAERKELVHQLCETVWVGPDYMVRFRLRLPS